MTDPPDAATPPTTAAELGRVAWGPVVAFALLGALIAVGAALADLSRSEPALGHLVVTSEEDPAADVLVEDGLDHPIDPVGRHDGAYFYAISRDLWDLDAAASHLDRSHYRMQRILFPAVAHLLHPSPGPGLVWTMFVLGAAAIAAGGVATGALSQSLRGPPWIGVVFGALPAAYISLRITAADPLAVALALWAAYFFLRRMSVWAVLAACAAVLTKESMWLVFAGLWMWRRERRDLPVVVVPAAVAAAWWVFLRLTVDRYGAGVIELTAPFAGWVEAVRFWGDGYERDGMLMAVLGVGVIVAALARRGLRHPFGWTLLLHLGLLVVLIGSAIGPARSAGRTLMAPLTLAAVALVAPDVTLRAGRGGRGGSDADVT